MDGHMKIDKCCLTKAINRSEISQQTSISQSLPEVSNQKSQNPDEGRVVAVEEFVEVEVEDHQHQQDSVHQHRLKALGRPTDGENSSKIII